MDVGSLYGLVVVVFMEIVVENESCKGLLLCYAVRDIDTVEAGPEKGGDNGVPSFAEASTARSAWRSRVQTMLSSSGLSSMATIRE